VIYPPRFRIQKSSDQRLLASFPRHIAGCHVFRREGDALNCLGPGCPFSCVFRGQEVGPGSRVAPEVDGLLFSGARFPLRLPSPVLFFDHIRCKSLPTAIQLQLPGLSIVADTRRRLLVRPLCVPTFQRSGSGSRSQRLLPRNRLAPANRSPRVPHSSSVPFAARAFLPPSVSSCLDQASLPTLWTILSQPSLSDF